MKYVAHLGRNKELALAELLFILGEEAIRKIHNNYVLIDTDIYLNQDFLNRLGGTIAIYKLFSTFRSEISEDEVIDIMLEDLKATSSKVNIALDSRTLGFQLSRQILKKIKKNLKNLQISCRFIEKSSTASFIGAGFLKGKVAAYRTFDFESINYFTRLIALQDINKYSLRDYEKPYRDAKLGMHPPKLSQIMLSLAGEYQYVYDPFCGTGTVLLEAALRYKGLKGSDIKPENVFGTIKNIEWLQNEFDIQGLAYDIFQGDARNITKDALKQVDIIVTEGFLGSPKKGNEAVAKLESEMQELENLYLAFLTNLSSKLTKKTTIVLNFPVFVYGRKKIFFKKILEKLKSLGYSSTALLPESDRLGLEKKESLIYERPGQKVLREVRKFIYNPG